MSIDESEFFQFSQFVTGKLQSGGAELTPEECLELWRLQHPTSVQYIQNVQTIQAAIDEWENGNPGISADELHSRLRSKYSSSHAE